MIAPTTLAALVLLSLASCWGCSRNDAGPSGAATGSVATTASTTVAAETSSHGAQASNKPVAHDPAHPPIDCPLRAQGINPHDMKPFQEVETYIAFLERADRATWQKPDVVVAALKLSGDETVVDLGAGSGYFSFRLAKALPRGKVVAIDVEPEMVRHIHHRAMTQGVTNIEATLTKPDDPGDVGAGDLVFICDVLHHVGERDAWLARLFAKMKQAARLVVIEFKEGPLPQGPPETAKVTRTEIVRGVTQAGFVATGEESELLPYQTLFSFRKP